MRLLKPSWVSHEGNPIFSLDIHPDGTRLATGGQGDDSGRVVIWNMAPIANEDDEKDENIPKMLCQMDNHLACVNCVRWSNNGKFLASGGDDKIIMIWQTGRYSSGSAVFGSSGKVNIEQWRCANTLRGHNGDILDLAWSPHDAWLATCSVDNNIVVWNALKFPETLVILRGHSGLVKGVSWDPVGKYLASQSDDKSLFVWRTLDWQQETVITEPFDECGGTTHVLRLSWSPDGQYLVSAHAMNNSGPTAQIIERDGWRTEKDFVGHRKAVTVAKFNPNILAKPSKEHSKMQHYCCCALGSRDRSLSIWLTALKRPLVVIHDLFANSVLDLSWSRKGHQLTVCSGDGTVAFLDFSEEEIGRPLSQEEQMSMHQKMYGKSLVMLKAGDSAMAVIENPAMLKLKEQQPSSTDNDVETLSQDKEPMKFCAAAKGPINRQIETRTADGRRRITPMFIAPAPDLGDAPLPFNSKTHPTFSSSTESKSKIFIEKRDEVVPTPNSNSSRSNGSNAATARENGALPAGALTLSLNQATPHVDSTVPVISAAPTPVTTTNVTPATVTTTNKVATITKTTAAPPASSTVSTVQSAAVTTPNVTPAVTSASVSVIPVETPKIPVNKVERSSEKFKESKSAKTIDAMPSLKRKETDEINRPLKRRPGRPPLSDKLVTTTTTSVVNMVSKPQVTPSIEKQQHQVETVSRPVLALPPLKLEKHISYQVTSPGALLVFDLDNTIQGLSNHSLCKLRCTLDGVTSYEVLLHTQGIALSASRNFAAVVCEDNNLTVFSTCGQRLFPCIVLTAACSRLACNDSFLMVITSNAYVDVWDIKNKKIIVKQTSLRPIMSAGADISIVSSTLTDNGCPVISLSTRKAFLYSHSMATWMLISNADDILQQCSDHRSCVPTSSTSSDTNFPLAALQSLGSRVSQQAGRLFSSSPSLQQAGTLSFLDSQLAASVFLHSRAEYKFWLLTLARYSTQEGLEARIREMCSQLLGPLHSSSSKSLWDPYILGYHKHDLLNEILLIISSNLRLQRVFTEYQEQLEATKT